MIRKRQPSRQMIALLAAMAEEPMAWVHGFDLMKRTGLSSGTLYPLLIRMTGKGLVEAEWQDPVQPGRPARHAYRLTAAGIALAASAGPNGAPSGLSLA